MQERLLIVTPAFAPSVGGYAHAATNFAVAVQRFSSVEVTVCTPALEGHANGDQGTHLESGLTLISLPRRAAGFRYRALVEQVLWAKQVAQLLNSERWHKVLIETMEQPLMTWLLLRLVSAEQRAKIMVRMHGTNALEGFLTSSRLLHRWYWRMVSSNLRRLDHLCTTTPYYLDFVAEHVFAGTLPADKRYSVVSNVVWAPADAEPDSATPGASVDLLALGRLNKAGYHQKNFELLAHGVKTYLEQGGSQDLKVVVIGEGESRETFTQLLRQLDIARYFELHNRADNSTVRLLQQNARGVMMLSRFEGQSMFALEAVASGASLVVTQGTGSTSLVEDGRTGYVIAQNDPVALAEAVNKLMNAPAHAQREAVRARYDACYHPEVIVDAFLRDAGFSGHSQDGAFETKTN